MKNNSFDKGVNDFGEEVGKLGKKVSSIFENQEKKDGTEVKRLYRSGKEKLLGGVCGGIAEYLKVDPVLIRLIWVLAVLFGGAGVLFYIIAWIIIPRNPAHKWD